MSKYKDWFNGIYKQAIDKYKERKEKFLTISGKEVQPLYVPSDASEKHYDEKVGFPGEYPYTRGIQPTMYRGKLWTMRQYAGFGTAAESNKRYKYLLEKGQTGLSVAFDLPTQIGYDSDDSLSLGEVGKVGVAIDTVEDMATLFQGIPLDKVSTSMTINAPAAILLAMYIVVAEEQGVSADKLTGTIQNDILKEYMARGTYIFPPAPSMRLITDTFAYCTKHLPKFNTISISGYHIREAGSTAAQEVAFTLADGIAYVQAALDVGLDVDNFGKRLSFFFAGYTDVFEEVAKFRASRRIWAKIMKDKFKCTNDRAMMLRFHTQTGGATLTAQQVQNNIVRVAIQALAAALGGTQSLHTNSFDEALGLPTEQSASTALRTQQVIAYESGVAQTIDPLAGSYFVEELTDKIEKDVWAYLEIIEKKGGMGKAIEEGFPQKEIQNSAFRLQTAIEEKENIVVGVNDFTIKEEVRPEILKVNPKIEIEQVARLTKIKNKRNNEKVEEILKRIKVAATSNENLFPLFIEAVRMKTSLGEICNVLREVFGEYKENIVV